MILRKAHQETVLLQLSVQTPGLLAADRVAVDLASYPLKILTHLLAVSI